MPIELREENGGKVLVVHASGTFVKADYPPFVAEFERRVQKPRKQHVLFDMTGLRGWDAGAAWEDMKFDFKHFADIDRLAIVGDKKWQHGMAIVLKPFTKAAIRYFDETESAEARKWLEDLS
jgi:hypothetical protein